MSKFSRLRKHLGFAGALPIYSRIKQKKFDDWKLPYLTHPFSIRNNPYDYHTFEEVLLEQTYKIDIDFKPRTILDGGGNIGLTAVYLASRFPDAEIVTVEPDTDNFTILSKNIASYKNIRAYQGGIWSKDTNLMVKDAGQGNNAFTVEETTETTGSIPSFSISSLIKKQGWKNADMIKLDIEGSEKQVFSENFSEWLPATRILVVELHDRMMKGCSKAVFNAIGQYDFSCHIQGENLVFINENIK